MQAYQPSPSSVERNVARRPAASPVRAGQKATAASRAAGRRWWIALALLVAVGFLLRARYFGNPFMDVDEQFYLLAGDRLLHGSLPYVDIWDRKPFGLFLLYAAIRLLGGDGIVQYQVVATLFAVGTAMMIALIARRISTPRSALVGALAYLPALAMNGGAGGQSPVFYNLPMAVAGWLLVRLATGDATVIAVRRHGAIAMLLVGVAMQIKYSALFEGVYFGLALIVLSWRGSRQVAKVAGDCLLWIAIALSPTMLAFAWYAHRGQADSFVYANFVSIFQRGPDPWEETSHDLVRAMLRLSIFVVPIVIGEVLLLRDRGAPWLNIPGGKTAHLFVIGWVVAAVIGYAVFGSFYDHYALPLLVPLSVACAPAFAIARHRVGATLAGLVLAILMIAYPINAAKQERRHGDAGDARAMTAAIAAHLHGGCPYIFYGDPILYHLTGACLPSRWVFPFHLSLQREAAALGVDPLVEARRIMDSRPPVVVDRLNDDPDVNLGVQDFVRDRLARDYRLVYRHPHAARNPDVDQVWALKR